MERKRRAAELEKEQKKAAMMREVQLERERQRDMKDRKIALQARQERETFERVLQAQSEMIAADEEKAQADKARARAHREAVQQQINEREQTYRATRAEFFQEGVKLDNEASARKQRLNEIKARKLEELRVRPLVRPLAASRHWLSPCNGPTFPHT